MWHYLLSHHHLSPCSFSVSFPESSSFTCLLKVGALGSALSTFSLSLQELTLFAVVLITFMQRPYISGSSVYPQPLAYIYNCLLDVSTWKTWILGTWCLTCSKWSKFSISLSKENIHLLFLLTQHHRWVPSYNKLLSKGLNLWPWMGQCACALFRGTGFSAFKIPEMIWDSGIEIRGSLSLWGILIVWWQMILFLSICQMKKNPTHI